MTDTTALLALVGGPILSTLIAYVLGLGFRRNVGTALTFVLCTLYAVGETILTGALAPGTPHDALGTAQLVVTNVFIVLAGAYTTYEHVLKPTGAAVALNAAGPQVGVPQPDAPAPVPVPTPVAAPVAAQPPVVILNVLPGTSAQTVTDAIVAAVTPPAPPETIPHGYSPTPPLS